MGITLLGPVTVDGNGPLGPRDRVVLAVLALRPGTAVATDRLAEALWGDRRPPSWNKVVPGCVMRLRRVLGPEAIATTSHGYRLTVPADDVDARRFESLVARGRELLVRGDTDRAAYALREALELWHGRALADLGGWEPGRIEAERLEGLRLDAEEDRWEAELATGRHREVLTAAKQGVTEAPLRERRWGVLALAEYRSGRQGDALRTIHAARTTLATQLGLEVGPELAALEWAILVHDPGLQAAVADAPASVTCPYLGLVPYDVADAAAFYGRDREVAECIRRLTIANMLTVVGPSGSGKSSLVRAGVAAALQGAGRAVAVITPGSHPMTSLAAAPLHSVLVVDQCEEATVLCADPRERGAFFDAIAAHSTEHSVVVAIRSDRIGDLAEHPSFARLVEGSLYLLGAMGGDELRAAIEGPALDARLALEPGLVDILVRDVEGEPGALPLLSHALRQTWEFREGRTLTVEGYRATGGIRGAVAHSAEALYEALPPERRRLLRALLLRLVATTPDGEPVRTRMPRRLVAIDADHEQVVDRLVNARLVTADETTVELAHESLTRAWPRLRGWLDDDVNGQRILRHVVGAADAWNGLGRPTSELYRGIRLAQALEWRDHTQPDLGPDEHAFLDAAWHQEADERRAARRRAGARRRARTLYAVGAVAAVIGVIAAAVTIRRAADQADDRSRTAVEARRASTLALAAEDPRLAMLLAVEGARLADDAEVRATLQTVVQQNAALVRTMEFQADLWRLAVSPIDGTVAVTGFADDQAHLDLLDHETLAPLSGVDARAREWSDVQYRPGGSQVAASGFSPWPGFQPRSDHLVLLDAATLEPDEVQLGGVPDSIDIDAAYSADGRFLAASFDRAIGSGGATVLVWSMAAPETPILQLDDDGQWVPGVALSADGSQLYVWQHNDNDGPMAVYDVASGRMESTTRPLPPNPRGCCPPGGSELEVDADGTTVATAQRDGIVIYNAGSLIERIRLPVAAGRRAPHDVEFSHDGAMLAAVDDGGVIVWDAATWQQRLNVSGGASAVAFSANDATLLTVSGGRLAEWDLSGDRRFVDVVSEADHRFFTHTPAPDGEAAVYSRDGRTEIKIWNTDDGQVFDAGTIRLWGYESAWRPPDFDTLAIATRDGTVQVVDRRSGKVIAERLLDRAVTAMGFTERGDLVVAEDREAVVVLDGDSLEPAGSTVRVDEDIAEVYPTADGRQAAVLTGRSSDDRQGYAVIDFTEGVIRERGDVGFVHIAGAISPDGTRLAVVGRYGEVGILRLDGPGWVRPTAQTDLRGEVRTVSYAPDGSAFVIADEGGLVQLWDASTGMRITAIAPGQPGQGASAVFHPDGHSVIIATADGAVFRWDTRIERAIEIACAAAGRNMTTTEWLEAFPDRPYRETCPAN